MKFFKIVIPKCNEKLKFEELHMHTEAREDPIVILIHFIDEIRLEIFKELRLFLLIHKKKPTINS